MLFICDKLNILVFIREYQIPYKPKNNAVKIYNRRVDSLLLVYYRKQSRYIKVKKMNGS